MIINENGKYPLTTVVRGSASSRMILYVSGVFGTADVKLQYQDELGQWIDLENGVVLVNTQNSIDAGAGAKIFLDVTNSDANTEIAYRARGVS